MKILSFELTMPRLVSWNGKWTGADNKYYIIKKVSDRFFKNNIEKLLDDKITHNSYRWNSWYYNFGDGWGVSVEMQIIDLPTAKKRIKVSRGFRGCDWMVNSIISYGEILTESSIRERIKVQTTPV